MNEQHQDADGGAREEYITQATMAAPDPAVRRVKAVTSLRAALNTVKSMRPEERDEEARYWAIVITILEQALSLFIVYILNPSISDTVVTEDT